MQSTAADPAAAAPFLDEDAGLVAAVRAGDEAAFSQLVTRHHAALVRVARGRLGCAALAEDVAQETWLAALRGLDAFEGRAPFRGWLFRILVNRASVRLTREARTIPFSALGPDDEGGPAVDPDRFLHEHGRWSGAWARPPERFPDEQLHTERTLQALARAMDQLPPSQREVLFLRDVEGWSGPEVCEALGLSEANQRVLLHRARSKVRALLERHFGGEEVA